MLHRLPFPAHRAGKVPSILAECPSSVPRPEAREVLTTDVLKQIARNANQGKPTLDDEDRQTLAKAIVSTPGLKPRLYSHLTSDKAKEDFSVDKQTSTTAQDRTNEPWNDKDVKNAIGGSTLGI